MFFSSRKCLNQCKYLDGRLVETFTVLNCVLHRHVLRYKSKYKKFVYCRYRKRSLTFRAQTLFLYDLHRQYIDVLNFYLYLNTFHVLTKSTWLIKTKFSSVNSVYVKANCHSRNDEVFMSRNSVLIHIKFLYQSMSIKWLILIINEECFCDLINWYQLSIAIDELIMFESFDWYSWNWIKHGGSRWRVARQESYLDSQSNLVPRVPKINVYQFANGQIFGTTNWSSIVKYQSISITGFSI